MSRHASARGAQLIALLVMGLASGCESCLKRVPLDSVEVLPYPTCDAESAPGDEDAGELIHAGHLRSGPGSLESVVERYEYRRRGCHIVLTVRQEWPRAVSDVEVVFDEEWRPLRAWKRMTVPGSEVVDTRWYELRVDPAQMTWRGEEGLQHFWFRGGSPIAVVGPGRGVFSAWIQSEGGLEVGETVRGPVLDFRSLVERVKEVALRRDPDRDVPGLGRVQVYTVFGRESLYVDEDGWVVGDLGGLRPDAMLDTPPPAPLPSATPPDPRGTP